MFSWHKNIILPKSFYALLIISFLTIWGYGAQRVIVPIQLNDMGTDLLMMGIILSLFGIPRASMNIAGGYLSDRFSKKNNIIISVILFGVISPYFIGASNSDIGVGVWRVMLAIGISWATTAIVSYLAEITKGHIRGTAIGIQKMITWLGMALAGLLAPILLVYFSFSIIMIFTVTFSIIALFFAFFMLKEISKKHTKEAVEKELKEDKDQNGDSTMEHQQISWFQRITLSWSGSFIKMIEDGMITFFIPIFVITQFQKPITVGAIISIFTFVYVISQPLGGILNDIIGSWKVIFIGLIFIIVGSSLLLLPTTLLWLYFAAIVLGIGCGMVVTSGEAKASFIGAPGRRSISLGYWRFYRDLGSTVGPIVVGITLTFSTVFSLLIGLVVISCISALLVLFIVMNERRKITSMQEINF